MCFLFEKARNTCIYCKTLREFFKKIWYNYNKLNFLEDLPKCYREDLRRKYKIPKALGKSAVCKSLSKQPDIEDEIWKIINFRKPKNFSKEAVEYLRKVWGIK